MLILPPNSVFVFPPHKLLTQVEYMLDNNLDINNNVYLWRWCKFSFTELTCNIV